MTPDDANRPAEQDGSEQPPRSQAMVPYVYPNDEIDLVEVGVSLWRRWKLMAVVFLLCVGLALLFAFLVPKEYQYTTTVQVGTQIVGNRSEPVESPDAAAKKVENGYLPEIIQSYANSHGLSPKKLTFDVSGPAKTNLVVISGKAPIRFGSAYASVEKAAAQKLVNSELPITEIMKAKLNSHLAEEKANLQELVDPKHKALLESQITSLQAFQKQAREQQLKSSRRSSGATDAMSILLLSNQVQQAESNLAHLQQTLQVKLPNQIEAAKAKVASLKTQIDNLQASRVVAGPLRSVEPAGLSRTVIAVLGAVIGAILALLAAALANYGAAVRERIRGHDM